jgi:hypothetical protein
MNKRTALQTAGAFVASVAATTVLTMPAAHAATRNPDAYCQWSILQGTVTVLATRPGLDGARFVVDTRDGRQYVSYLTSEGMANLPTGSNEGHGYGYVRRVAVAGHRCGVA